MGNDNYCLLLQVSPTRNLRQAQLNTEIQQLLQQKANLEKEENANEVLGSEAKKDK